MSVAAAVLVAGVLLAASVAASLAADRLRLPVLMVFLAIGMVAGSAGTGIVDFDDYGLTREIGLLALALILFDGALRTGLGAVRGVIAPALRLAVGGTVIVSILVGIAAAAVLQRPLLDGLLVGSILAATDSAAVFGLLRTSSLRPRLVRTIEAESGFNDAVALALVIGFAGWVSHPHNHGALTLVGQVFRELAVGAAAGAAVGVTAAAAFSRVRLRTEGLYAVATLAAAALALGAATAAGGSGLLAVYIGGLIIGDSQITSRRTVVAFHGGLAWLAQAGLFLMLGLLAAPGRIGHVAPAGVVLAVFVVLVARPIATLAMLGGDEFSLRERIVVSWSEFVGATPLLFAAFAAASGTRYGREIFDLVLVVVIVATLAQGLSFEPLARRLGVTFVPPLLPAPLTDGSGPRRLGAEIVEYAVVSSDNAVGRRLSELRLPLGISVMLVVRREQAVPPTSVTRLESGDVLHLLVREEMLERLPDVVGRLRHPAPEDLRGSDSDGSEFVCAPWSPVDGDPGRPEVVRGLLVLTSLCSRSDRPGSLVRLEDGRYAVTGPTLAIAAAGLLGRYVRQQIAGATDPREARWWNAVLATLPR
jgi:cell volume regulation protein A